MLGHMRFLGRSYEILAIQGKRGGVTLSGQDAHFICLFVD